MEGMDQIRIEHLNSRVTEVLPCTFRSKAFEYSFIGFANISRFLAVLCTVSLKLMVFLQV